MANNIDATPTRAWDGARGFDPISILANRFRGVFDGGGNVVRGLHIDRANLNNIGLFAGVSGAGDGVVNLGLDDARIRGKDNVGAIAGILSQNSGVRAVWARGRVQGRDAVGGLIGASSDGNLSVSWFAGQVAGNNRVGGLAGDALNFADFTDSWAAVDIVAPTGARAGELVGLGVDLSPGNLTRMWGEGYLSADFLASGANLSFAHTEDIRALGHASFDSNSAWNVGRTGASGDFPILTSYSESTQGAAIAYGLTRASAVGGGVLSEEDPTLIPYLSPTIVFDLNGDEDDADPACVANANGSIATGYNDAIVSVSLPSGAQAAAGGVCGYVLEGFDSGEMTLTVSFMSGGDSIAREYPLAIDEERRVFLAFLAEMAADPANWLADDDDDLTINAYDRAPRSGVTLFEEGIDYGNAENPWPVL